MRVYHLCRVSAATMSDVRAYNLPPPCSPYRRLYRCRTALVLLLCRAADNRSLWRALADCFPLPATAVRMPYPRESVRGGVPAGRYRGDGCRVPDADAGAVLYAGACPRKSVLECLPNVIVGTAGLCPKPMPDACRPMSDTRACRLPPAARCPTPGANPAPDACRESNANGAPGRLWQTCNR